MTYLNMDNWKGLGSERKVDQLKDVHVHRARITNRNMLNISSCSSDEFIKLLSEATLIFFQDISKPLTSIIEIRTIDFQLATCHGYSS